MIDGIKIPSHWSWATFNDVAKVASDLVDPTVTPDAVHIAPNHIESKTGKLLPFTTVASDRVTSPKHRFHSGQILYSKIRPYLAKAAQVSFGGVCSADMYPIDSLIDSKYLFQWLLSPWFTAQTAQNQGRTILPKINQIALGRLPVPVPPVGEQERIAAKIDELFSDLDAGVAALERAKANLKRYRAAVLKAAVEGTLTEQWRAEHPNTEPASKLLERALAERRRKWESDQLAKFTAAGKQPPKNWRANYVEPAPPPTSDLPKLPAGWCWASVEQLGTVQLGRQRSPKYRSNKFPTKYIRAANLTEAGLDISDVLDMDFQPGDLETYRLHPGDVLLSEASGSPDQVGKPAVWNGEIENCCFQNTVIRLRPVCMLSDYALTVFRHYYWNKLFAKVAAGVGINHLSAYKFSTLAFPLAPLDEQSQIVAEVAERLSEINAADTAIGHGLVRAARLRQSILKQAFEGNLVAQDPMDEPASVLLERLRSTSRVATRSARKHRNGKAVRA